MLVKYKKVGKVLFVSMVVVLFLLLFVVCGKKEEVKIELKDISVVVVMYDGGIIIVNEFDME